jgi:hypothetical protein
VPAQGPLDPPLAAHPVPRHAGVVLYGPLADAVMLAHFGFLAFLAVGGFLALRWRPLVVAHVGAVGWGLYSVVVGVECPLTVAEDHLRGLAGEQGLPGGFIDTYLAAVVSPAPRLHAVQALVAALVLVSWARFAAVRGRTAVRSRRTAAGRGPG